MSYSKISVLMFFSACLISNSVYAEGVFLTQKRGAHGLSKADVRKINIEFLQKFGGKQSAGSLKGANPWQAKKERKQKQKQNTTSWGECRDYSLQQRNLCYKEGRQAYYCERFYEARSDKCNRDY